MGTRAIQIDKLLAGLRGTDDAPLLNGTVYFYAAGTSNTKNVWTEKEKTNPFTSVTLDSFGKKQIYADGNYKLVVKDSAANTLHTWDDIKLQANTFSVVTKTANYTATPDDDVVLCDTDGGAFTVEIEAASTFEHPITIKNTGSSSNDVTVDPDGSETVDGSTTVAIADGLAQTLHTDGSNWFAKYAAAHAASHLSGGADPITDLIKGDGTAGRVLRVCYARITGEADAEITGQLYSQWNGDTDGPEADVAKSETSNNWTLDASGAIVTIEASGLSGNVVAAWGGVYNNDPETYGVAAQVAAASNDIQMTFRNINTGAAYDLTGMGAAEVIDIQITYITAA